MTPRDKLRALLAKAEGLEARATKAPWRFVILEHYEGFEIVPPETEGSFLVAQGLKDPYDAQLIILSRNGFLPVLRMLVERLDECRCCGTGVSLDGGYGPCPSCIPCYAALCAELEKLGAMEIDIPA